MKKYLPVFRNLLLLGMIAFSFNSCVKEDYDDPGTANVDPNLTVTHSLADLRAMAVGSTPIAITTDMIVAGIITADDESGTFYKEMVIQDSTAAISILLDISNYNSNYPIGRRVYIKCNGLYVAEDADGNVELGARNANEIGRIPDGNVPKYIVPGKWNLSLPYVDVSLATLVNNLTDYTQQLVRIPTVEFEQQDAGTAWGGDPNSTFDNNRTAKDCGSNTLIVYTSSFAIFANTFTPTGNGTLSGILKIYRGDGELIIRTPADAETMTGLRCDSLNLNATQMPIDSLRMIFTGTTTTAPIGRKIKGIVISDYINANIQGNNMVIQDSTGGIVVRFTSANTSFQLGDEVEVNVSGQELSEYNGWLQVNNVSLGNARKTGTGTITPRVATIADILANYESWESTLIKVNNVTITGGTSGTWNSTTTFTDATGSIISFTRSAATFSGTAYPTTPSSVTGILSEFTSSTFTPQLLLRNASDVQ